MTDKGKLEKIKALADKMYSRMAYLTSDTRPIRQAMDEYHQFIINEYHKEEPVSEDLEKEIDEYISILTERRGNFPKLTKLGFRTIARHFANWQQQKDSIPVSEDLEEAGKEWLRPQLDKTYANYGEVKMMELTHFDGYAMLDAIEFGANWQKKQMMAKAVDATVHIDAGGYPYIPQMELYDYEKDIPLAKKGDKYKVILIKEG